MATILCFRIWDKAFIVFLTKMQISLQLIPGRLARKIRNNLNILRFYLQKNQKVIQER
jgi:hypothetical protein